MYYHFNSLSNVHILSRYSQWFKSSNCTGYLQYMYVDKNIVCFSLKTTCSVIDIRECFIFMSEYSYLIAIHVPFNTGKICNKLLSRISLLALINKQANLMKIVANCVITFILEVQVFYVLLIVPTLDHSTCEQNIWYLIVNTNV